MSAPEAKRRLLEHAATRLGGVEELAKKLGISERLVNLYLTDAEPLPDSLFLLIVDLIADDWRQRDAQAAQSPKADR